MKYERSKRTHRLIEPELGQRPIPNLELTDQCVVMSDDVINVIKMSCFQNIKTDNGGVTIRLIRDGMVFESASEVESAEMVVEGTTELTADEQRALFSLQIILPVLKTLPKSTIVTVSLMTNMPMKISIDEATYSMDIYVAPYIIQE